MWSLTTTAPVTFVEAHAPSANETDSARQTKHLMEPEMTAGALIELHQLFESAGVEVWLDGGWAVDAALGEGFGSVTVTTDNGKARIPSVRTMVEADVKGWLPAMGIVLAEEQIERILGEAERVLQPFVTPEGTATFDTSGHIVTGIKA